MELISVSKEQDVAVVRPTMKRLDGSVAPAFKGAMQELIGRGEKRLVLDLEGVDFMDSSGLGAMVSVLKALGGTGALAVCNVRGGVLSLFKLTRMDKVFAIADTREDALRRAAA
ncbi:STAS domain-containing protein [Noviherbaspirillum pedocola]|uniref:Anti-sigma factor antagonist n=1 Tax=Noviherbaspirillum pedocola TaxID=2801341 RepID=A0A934W847_9BURK|nr:STAS domain-containing protein [Noviherbaspirillum pedocola]MBK4735399.1 STAS domain-containing protein [Noviherbaspirillum pedocola]